MYSNARHNNSNGSLQKSLLLRIFPIIFFSLLREEFITGQSLNEFAGSPEVLTVAVSHPISDLKGNDYTHKKFIA